MKNDTAWNVSIDYDALPEAIGSKAKLARGRGARSAIKAAGYMPETTFKYEHQKRAYALAKEITEASGVPMRVDECVLFYL